MPRDRQEIRRYPVEEFPPAPRVFFLVTCEGKTYLCLKTRDFDEFRLDLLEKGKTWTEEKVLANDYLAQLIAYAHDLEAENEALKLRLGLDN